jgi:MFS family permease
VVAVCLLRGVGFGFTVVAGSALTASLLPAERRGEGLALIGMVSGGCALTALPLGVWLSAHAGYGAVFVLGAVVALAAIPAVPGLPDRIHAAGRPVGVAAALRAGELRRPALVFSVTAVAAGVVVTFLPLALPARATGLATAALVVQPTAAMAARWLAGRHGDRHGSAGLLLPGLLLTAAGTLVMALTGSQVAVLLAMAAFGVGFGITYNASQALLYARVPTAAYGTVSALWNFAYDAGMGVGALAFGWLAATTGYPWAFALTAAAMVTAALAPALAEQAARPTVRQEAVRQETG